MVISNLKFSEMVGGGAFWSEIPERGFLENLDKNLLFSQKPACASQSLSHTTYVETNDVTCPEVSQFRAVSLFQYSVLPFTVLFTKPPASQFRAVPLVCLV